MSFGYRSPVPRDHDVRRALMTSFGLVLLFVATLSPTMYMVDNASGQGLEEETTTEEEKNNIELVRQYFSSLDTGNVSNASQFISPQYFTNDGFQADPAKAQLRGPAAFIDSVNTNREAFPDLRREIQAIITQGDMVVAITNITATHKGNFLTLPPTGNKISYQLVHIFRIGEDGKISEHGVFRNNLTLLTQLGVIGPTSVSPKHRPFFEALTGGVTNSSRQ